MIGQSKQHESLHKPYHSNPLQRYLINKSKLSPTNRSKPKQPQNNFSFDFDEVKRHNANPFLLNNLNIQRHTPADASADWYSSKRINKEMKIKKKVKTNQPLLNILLNNHQQPKQAEGENVEIPNQPSNRPQTNNKYRCKQTRSQYPLKMSKKSIELDQCFMIKISNAKCIRQMYLQEKSKHSKFYKESSDNRIKPIRLQQNACQFPFNQRANQTHNLQITRKYANRQFQSTSKVQSLHKQNKCQTKRKVDMKQKTYKMLDSSVNPWSTTMLKGCCQELTIAENNEF